MKFDKDGSPNLAPETLEAEKGRPPKSTTTPVRIFFNNVPRAESGGPTKQHRSANFVNDPKRNHRGKCSEQGTKQAIPRNQLGSSATAPSRQTVATLVHVVDRINLWAVFDRARAKMQITVRSRRSTSSISLGHVRGPTVPGGFFWAWHDVQHGLWLPNLSNSPPMVG